MWLMFSDYEWYRQNLCIQCWRRSKFCPMFANWRSCTMCRFGRLILKVPLLMYNNIGWSCCICCYALMTSLCISDCMQLQLFYTKGPKLQRSSYIICSGLEIVLQQASTTRWIPYWLTVNDKLALTRLMHLTLGFVFLNTQSLMPLFHFAMLCPLSLPSQLSPHKLNVLCTDKYWSFSSSFLLCWPNCRCRKWSLLACSRSSFVTT